MTGRRWKRWEAYSQPSSNVLRPKVSLANTSPWISLWDGSIKGRLWNKTLVKLYLFAEADSDTRGSV